MKYYEDMQFIAQVNKEDKVQGKVERWKAHKEHILHRAITVAVFIDNSVILQHRKHPVFDNVFDMTASTHQVFIKDTLESNLEAVYRTLDREFNLSKDDIVGEPVQKGNLIYEAQDPRSKYSEHEVCHLYICNIRHIPQINLDFAYGYSLQKIEDITSQKSPLYGILAPWAKGMVEKKLI